VTYLRSISLWGLAVLATGPACSHERGPDPTSPLASEPQTPRRLRRLSNREMENVFADLLGERLDLTKGFLRDPRFAGYDNDVVALGVSESKLDEVATAAERAAAYLTAPERLDRFAPCPAGDEPIPCARAFTAGITARAWGRAASASELDRLADVFRVGEEGGSYAAGIALVAEAVLQSPHFVYRSELGEGPVQGGRVRLTAAEIASAISFAVAGSRPDAQLLAAAGTGDLFEPEGREREGRRVLATPAARRQLRGFLRAWLRLTDVATMNKDLGIFPEFTPPVRQAMDRELDAFLDGVLDGSGRLDELLLADYGFPGPALAPIYQDDVLDPVGNFTRVRLDGRRRGVLSLPAFLATHALIDQTNPVERGLMIRANVLCQEIAPPPAGVNAVTPPGAPGVTTRAKYSAHSEDGRCRPCHQLMDPIGFGFEAFDTLGRYRTVDNGEPVDARGELLGTDIDGPFTGPAELSARLARSAQFRRCFVQQLWRFGEGRAAAGGDEGDLAALAAGFEQADHRIGDLVLELIKRPSFILRKAAEVAP
jgi:Protein of unknown function (DUF1588)/Protein of unknown function (DUF1592)/Protein of unknown function (DUF1595)/Protein of unknown function (DUF1585)/Protein of unknown function (DUF1587)